MSAFGGQRNFLPLDKELVPYSDTGEVRRDLRLIYNQISLNPSLAKEGDHHNNHKQIKGFFTIDRTNI